MIENLIDSLLIKINEVEYKLSIFDHKYKEALKDNNINNYKKLDFKRIISNADNNEIILTYKVGYKLAMIILSLSCLYVYISCLYCNIFNDFDIILNIFLILFFTFLNIYLLIQTLNIYNFKITLYYNIYNYIDDNNNGNNNNNNNNKKVSFKLNNIYFKNYFKDYKITINNIKYVTIKYLNRDSITKRSDFS